MPNFILKYITEIPLTRGKINSPNTLAIFSQTSQVDHRILQGSVRVQFIFRETGTQLSLVPVLTMFAEH